MGLRLGLSFGGGVELRDMAMSWGLEIGVEFWVGVVIAVGAYLGVGVWFGGRGCDRGCFFDRVFEVLLRSIRVMGVKIGVGVVIVNEGLQIYRE